MNVVHTLKVIAQTLNMGDDLTSMLQSVLEKLLEVTNHDTGWIFLIEGHRHHLIAHQGLPNGLEHRSKLMCEGGCWCKDKCMNGQLKKAANIMECRRIERASELGRPTNGLTHHATVPIVAGDQTYGLINIASADKNHFSTEELEALETVALQIGAAIYRLKQEEKKQELARMDERNKLARDLHDSVNQLLFSVSLTAKGIKGKGEDTHVNEAIDLIGEVSSEALIKLKQIIWQTSTEELEDGIVAAIHRYAALIGIKVKVKGDVNVQLPSRVERNVWRIIQESINNCSKHSGEKSVDLHFYRDESNWKVSITDFGCGFSPQDHSIFSGDGFLNMRTRAQEIGATFNMKSAPDQGTMISISIPLASMEQNIFRTKKERE
ncbi:GAF domain-containing sensor histidine kinase [Alkalihalophilus marmarensis]|uniref:GAF domain-containing sensor histidine kinase n=1 Tax=Alkalihalophilus marmarensis TaxID=521377 RepID=UPI00204212CC|nr:GAF domain-containing sensor histidine kinase [Alkalihalophilus marmarensis]